MNPELARRQSDWRQWIAAFAASSTMFGINLDTVWGIGMDLHFPELKWKFGVQSSLIIIGAITGAIIADVFGRRRGLLMAWLFVIPRMIDISLTTVESKWINSAFISFGSGVTCSIVPLYIAEISRTNNTGNLMVMQQLVYYFGILTVWIVRAVFPSNDKELSEMAKYATSILLSISTIFHVIILSTYPETPHYLNWMKRHRDATKSLAFFEGMEHVKLRHGLRNSPLNENIKSRRQGWCKKIKEICQFGNRRSLAIIFTLITMRRATGQNRNVFVLLNMLYTHHGKETNLYPVIGLYTATLAIGILLILTVRLFRWRMALLLVIFISFIAAVMSIPILVKYYWLLVVATYLQYIGHIIFVGITLAYVGEFFLINIRSIAIAAVISWEVLMRGIFLLIDEFIVTSPYSQELQPYLNSLMLFFFFCIVMIFFPRINRVPCSKIALETSPNGRCVMVEKLEVR